jgi:hypothetical protein
MDGVHVQFSKVHFWDVRKTYCPTCKKNRYFWGWFQEWYGWEITCLKCGDVWQDGERTERPFLRGWRKASVKSALAHARRSMSVAPRLQPTTNRADPLVSDAPASVNTERNEGEDASTKKENA